MAEKTKNPPHNPPYASQLAHERLVARVRSLEGYVRHTRRQLADARRILGLVEKIVLDRYSGGGDHS